MSTICKAAMVAVFALGVMGSASVVQAQGYWNPNWSSYPSHQTPTYLRGYTYNPWTGVRPHTGGRTWHNSYYAPGRNLNPGVGNSWHVNRPQYDAFGNYRGHVRGRQWINPLTGQVHGNLQYDRIRRDGSRHTEQVHHHRVP